MNLVFIYLGEECLVIIYSASELAMGIIDVILQPGDMILSSPPSDRGPGWFQASDKPASFL